MVELFGVTELFYIPIMVVITQIHMCIKIHRAVHEKNKFYCVIYPFIISLLQIHPSLDHGPLNIFTLPAATVLSLVCREHGETHRGFAFLVLLCLVHRLLKYIQLLWHLAPAAWIASPVTSSCSAHSFL